MPGVVTTDLTAPSAPSRPPGPLSFHGSCSPGSSSSWSLAWSSRCPLGCGQRIPRSSGSRKPVWRLRIPQEEGSHSPHLPDGQMKVCLVGPLSWSRPGGQQAGSRGPVAPSRPAHPEPPREAPTGLGCFFMASASFLFSSVKMMSKNSSSALVTSSSRFKMGGSSLSSSSRPSALPFSFRRISRCLASRIFSRRVSRSNIWGTGTGRPWEWRVGGPGSQRRGASGLPSLCSRQPHRALLPADGKKAGAKYWSWEEGSRDAKSRSSKEYQAPDAGVKHALWGCARRCPWTPRGPAQWWDCTPGGARRASQDLNTRAFQPLWVPHGSGEASSGLPARATNLSAPAPPSPEQSLLAASPLVSAKSSSDRLGCPKCILFTTRQKDRVTPLGSAAEET